MADRGDTHHLNEPGAGGPSSEDLSSRVLDETRQARHKVLDAFLRLRDRGVEWSERPPAYDDQDSGSA